MATGGRRKQALLGDAMEAVIAAVYLDAGFDVAREMILRLWGTRVTAVDADARDAKTALQEWAQARGLRRRPMSRSPAPDRTMRRFSPWRRGSTPARRRAPRAA
jgi:dsRNA-specific ribonuclease